MGPAIRKAIAEALRGLVQSLNQALEHSLSWRGIKWRIEALRTGRTFAEVVLSKTLVYRVEQVFLIHRESGLLLVQAVAPEVEAQDAVHDAFVTAWRKYDSLRDHGRFEAWFDRIVVNVCRNRLKRASRRRTEDIEEQAALGTSDATADVHRRIEVERAFARLKPDDVVVLAISADLPFAQKRFCSAEGIDGIVPSSTTSSSPMPVAASGPT